MQKGVSAYFTKNILIQFFELNAQLNDELMLVQGIAHLPLLPFTRFAL